MTRRSIQLAAFRLFVLMACISSAKAATVNFAFADITGGTTNGVANRQLDIYPYLAPTVNGTTIVLTDYKPRKTDTNGTVSTTLTGPGTYRCVFGGTFSNTTFYVTLVTNVGTFNASDILSTPTNNVAGVAWATTTADRRFVLVMSGTASNFTIKSIGGETNVFFNTNGSPGQVLTYGDRGVYPAASSGGGSPSLNPNQFTTGGGQTNIKAGALVTNLSSLNLTNRGYMTNQGPVEAGSWSKLWGTATNAGTVWNEGPVWNQGQVRFQSQAIIGAITMEPSVSSIAVGANLLLTTAGINLGQTAAITQWPFLDMDGSFLQVDYLTASRAVLTDGNKRLFSATGTPDGTKFLRDDGTYAVPAVSGATATNIALGNVIYLSTDGNDATAKRGNIAKPFLTPTNAIANMQSGDTLVVWPGDYFVNTFGSPSATVAVSNGAALNLRYKTNVAIVGIGKPRFLFTNNITALHVFHVHNFTISGLSFVWTNKPGGASLTNLIACIDIGGTSENGRIWNSDFINFPDHAIPCSLADTPRIQTNIWIEGNYFEGGGATNNVPNGLVWDGNCVGPGSHWFIRNNRMRRCFRGIEAQVPAGDLIQYGDYSHNSFYAMQGESILLIGNSTSDAITDITIANNVISGQELIGSPFQAITGFGGGGMSRIHVIDNLIDGNLYSLGYGISFGGGNNAGNIKDLVIAGNQLHHISQTPIVVNGGTGASGWVTNATIVNNKAGDSQTGNGILFNGSSSLIAGNEVYNIPYRGIWIDASTGVSRDNTVARNDVHDVGSGGSSTGGLEFGLGSSNNLAFGNSFKRTTGPLIQDLNPAGHNNIGPNIIATNGAAFYGTNDLPATRIGFVNPYKGTNTGTFDFASAVTLYSTLTAQGLTTLNGSTNQSWSVTAGPGTNLSTVTLQTPSSTASPLEVRQGTAAALIGGINSNGVAFLQTSNGTVQMPAMYTIFNQTADGTACTNINTTFTSVLGTGVGSLTLTNGFWQVGRSIRGEFYGTYWTGASPLNTYFVVKLGSLIVCSNLFVPTASMVQKPWFVDVMITCRTNSPTVGAFVATGKLNVPSGAAFLHQPFTNLLTIADSTAAMAFDIQATNGATTTSFQTQNGSLMLR